MPGKAAILANPMSGRDVRRLAARASTTTHELKRDLVARIALGLDAVGVDEILILKEPYRVSSDALARLPMRAGVRLLDVGLTHSAADTQAAALAAREAGCGVIVSLGGDGTNRAIAGVCPDVPLLPLSTGTNNVFPVMVEATSAGVAAGLVAAGVVPVPQAARRCKLVRLEGQGWRDVAVIDAVLLRDDHTGNLLPFDAGRIAALVLARAEPAAVGTSPIGGYLDPTGFDDDWGLGLRCGSGRALHVPLSPGLFGTVRVAACERLAPGVDFVMEGPGVIALDGDRLHALAEGERAVLRVARDGPPVIDVARCIGWAAARGLLGREGEVPRPACDAPGPAP